MNNSSEETQMRAEYGTVGTLATSAVDKKPSPVDSALQLQVELLDELEKNIGSLVEKVRPLIKQEDGADEAMQEQQLPRYGNSPVVEHLAGNNYRLEILSRSVSYITNRLES